MEKELSQYSAIILLLQSMLNTDTSAQCLRELEKCRRFAGAIGDLTKFIRAHLKKDPRIK